MAKPPKLRVVPTVSPDDRLTLTQSGRIMKDAYLTRRKELTGVTRPLQGRMNSAELWNYAAEIADSLGAPARHFVDKLTEAGGVRDGFPLATHLASGYAGRQYLRIQNIRDIDDFDDRGLLLPHRKEEVERRTLSRSVSESKDRALDSDVILPIDDLELTKAELQAGTTILMKKVGTLDFFNPDYVKFVLGDFCTVPKHVTYVLAWRNPVIKKALQDHVKAYFLSHPDWLRGLTHMGSKDECLRVKLNLGLRP